MKRLTLSLMLSLITHFSISQTVEWVLNPYPYASNYENDLTRLATDGSGNVYDLVNRACGSFSCADMLVFKSPPNGLNTSSLFYGFQISPALSHSHTSGIDIVVDSVGNRYITASFNGDSILIYNTWINSNQFIIKSGQPSWVREGTGMLAADNSGNCYLTNGIYTEKFDSSGNTVWNNPAIGGNSIKVDKSGNCFITSLTGTTKLNSNGLLSWANGIGGTDNFLDGSGNIYVINGSQITKRDNFNNPLWVKSFPGTLKHVAKNGNIFTADGLTLTKFTSNGTFSWTYCASGSGAIEDIATDYSGNVFVTGDFFDNPYYSTNIYFSSITFCPHTLKLPAPNSFLAKITPPVNSSPRLIMQDFLEQGLYGPVENCTSFALEYTTCCDTFSLGNSFIAQLASDTTFTSAVIIGSVNATEGGSIPITIPLNGIDSGYMRIISTMPVVSSLNKFIKINKIPFVDTYATGNTAFCPGKGLVQIQALSNPSLFNFQWQNNGIDIPGETLMSYNAITAGNFRVARSTPTGCTKYSDTTSVKTYSNPSASITVNGATQFCTGDSVTLTANTGSNLLYQWKKSGSTISGANSMSYGATKTGTYKVLVTNVKGCTKLSSGIAVTGPPTAAILAGGLLTFCNGDSVPLIANAGTGYTYQWKKNGVVIPGANLITYMAKTAGVYRAIVTDSYGCSVTSNSKTVTVNCRQEEVSETYSEIKVYPNPNNGHFSFDIFSDISINDIAEIKLFNVLGQNIYQSQAFIEDGIIMKEIDVSGNLPKGVYSLMVLVSDAVFESKVIIN